MQEPDVVTFVNMITFSPDDADRDGKNTIFEYVVAEDYENTLVALEAINADTKYQLNVTKTDSPRYFNEDEIQYNATDFLWF